MSMNPSNGRKNTKGKQKIEIKMVEKNADRQVTFSKRKATIIKMLVELVTMLNIQAGFLVFSESGKPYTFAHPSMEKVAERVKNPEGQEAVRDGLEQLLDSQREQRIQEMMKKYEDLSEKLKTEKEKMKRMKEWRKETQVDKMWWNNLENLTKDQMQLRHDELVKLYDCLISRLGRDNGGSSSGQAGPEQSGGSSSGQAGPEQSGGGTA